jgi:hypothetical protein
MILGEAIMTDELKRYAVTLTSPGERTQSTFTWANTRNGAIARVATMLDKEPDVWGGWSFTVADEPTPESVS